MASAITRNKYAFPKGYTAVKGPTTYKPWNGSSIAASPARALLGATQIYNIASVPADLSTFILNAPNGQSYTFQFVYNASVQTTGIKIPLPNSGSSTAAQVQTAMLGVLGAAGGTPLSGSFVGYPWLYQQTGAAQFTINWKVAGATVAATGTQATITAGAVTQQTFGTQAVVPAKVGPVYGWLHGV